MAQNLCASFGAMSKPTLIAYTGNTMGGGFEVSLWSDVRIMAKDVKVGFPEVPLGILPGGTGTQTVARLIGRSLASYMILTSTLATAEKAVQYGLVDDPLKRALELATKMAQLPAEAYALAKGTSTSACALPLT
jgi:enoyl-CoA hydratase/carnithine racemase